MKLQPLTALIAAAAIALGQAGCNHSPKRLAKPGSTDNETTFSEDVAFLKKHVEVITLGQGAGQPQVAVVPAYQGRVMTSTVGGGEAPSHGWINYDLIASGKTEPHINAFGGEDRFWLGPEGGQFSIFFKKGDPFDLEHWQTPALIDTVSYKVTAKSDSEVTFRH